MIITKRIERLYSLKEYENIKVIYEATEDIWDKEPVQEFEKLSELLSGEIKKDAAIIKPKKE